MNYYHSIEDFMDIQPEMNPGGQLHKTEFCLAQISPHQG
jgi:hypothetical protein